MTSITSQCQECAHFDATNRIADTCAAFAVGIPREILLNQVDHRESVAGDGGVVWSPVTEGVKHPLGE